MITITSLSIRSRSSSWRPGYEIYRDTIYGNIYRETIWELKVNCASLPRTIFASLARAHERVHVQNVRDSPQTKLDSEINSPFLLNEHGDPRFFFFRYLLRTV